MDDKKFQMEVLERLTAIETTLKQIDFKSIENSIDKLKEKQIELDGKVKNNDKRIDKIEASYSWLWKTVGGAILLAILSLVIKGV